jgi:hypothetical protein
VALRCTLRPLDLPQTAAYIAKRLQIAGVLRPLFTRDAVEAVYERSQGIPRSISVICDNALVSGFALEEGPVTRRTVLEVCRDLDLLPVSGNGRSTMARPPVDHTARAESPVAANATGSNRDLFVSFTTRRRFSFF